MSKSWFLSGIIVFGVAGLLSFLALFFWSSPSQGLLAKTIFNLSFFILVANVAFFVFFFLQVFFVKALKRSGIILGDEWVHFRRGVFIGLSVVFLSFLNRANLFHWLEVIFLIILFFGWEFAYFKSKRLLATNI